jgi:tetratricopeptide (TPR) repeat protein
LFNGWESYDKGMQKLENSHEDNYAKLLTIFIYHNKDELSAINSEMDRSIQKATKVLTTHSITVKPEIDEDKELTPKQREFLNKSEYNKWVDDAYLLMGKSHFHKHEFKEASETFQYIVSNFPNEITQIESRIWLSRISLEQGRIKESENILAELEKETSIPKSLVADFEATLAYQKIQRNDFVQAAEHLEKALDAARSRYYKQRYNFILAQLYQKTNNSLLASERYQKVIKLNPPYEMTFNARINLALSYETGTVSRKDIEKQLQKMLRDDKNIDFQDQIYYAWGNLYFKEGDIDKAIDYYTLSASVSKENINQQALTYITLADIYYELPDYIPAQAYYDSAVSIITDDYPNYNVIYAKSISLTNLVENIETVTLQDSVQKLSYLPKAELYAFIDGLIEQEREREARERRLEEERQRAAQFDIQQQFEIQTNTSSWYFYNNTAIDRGRDEFKRKWGARKLEDNWRRANKSSIDPSVEFATNDEAETETDELTPTEKPTDKFSRRYYLVDIPFTDSSMEVSHLRIQRALYNMGDIYSQELKDFNKATNAFEDLLRRYPTYEQRLQVYYKLYSIGKQTENINMVSLYQQKIINEFPESNYAMVLSDPDYFKKMEAQEQKENDAYEHVYNTFNRGDYAQTRLLIEKALREYPESKYMREYDYMQTISNGVIKDTVTFISDLSKLISRYPDSEIAERSQLIIRYLQTENPEAAREQAIKQAATLFKISADEEHFVVVSVPKTQNSNQLMFNIINFNIDNFSESELKVKKDDLNAISLVSVVSFENEEKASEYFSQLQKYPDLFRDVDATNNQVFFISTTNFNLLKRDNKLEQYITYFNDTFRN